MWKLLQNHLLGLILQQSNMTKETIGWTNELRKINHIKYKIREKIFNMENPNEKNYGQWKAKRI